MSNLGCHWLSTQAQAIQTIKTIIYSQNIYLLLASKHISLTRTTFLFLTTHCMTQFLSLWRQDPWKDRSYQKNTTLDIIKFVNTKYERILAGCDWRRNECIIISVYSPSEHVIEREQDIIFFKHLDNFFWL